MTVTEGDEGDLPGTDGTVTAEETGRFKSCLPDRQSPPCLRQGGGNLNASDEQ